MNSSELLTLLLGGGAVASITAVFNGIKSLRDGARAREKGTVAQLVRQRQDAWDDREYQIDLTDYWRGYAGDYEFLLRQNGITIPERRPEPVKPSKPITPGEE